MGDGHACSDAELIASFEGFELFPHVVRLLARGEPVDVEELAELAGWPVGDVEAVGRSQAGTEWDHDGRLVGFGLTLRPTAHRFTVSGRTLYTWCAADTLMFTMILGEQAVAESTCPVTGEPVRIGLSPESLLSVSPPGAVITERHGVDPVADLRGEVCDHGLFFAFPAAASGWAAEHPDGDVLAVAEAFDRARSACEALGWLGRKGVER